MNNFLNYNPIDSLREQLKGQMQSLTQQLEELNQLERQSMPKQTVSDNTLSSSVRNEVDRYLNELGIHNTKNNSNDKMTSIINAIESNAGKEDLEYLVSNIDLIPDYFKSKEGAKTIQQVINGIKKSSNIKESVATE